MLGIYIHIKLREAHFMDFEIYPLFFESWDNKK